MHIPSRLTSLLVAAMICLPLPALAKVPDVVTDFAPIQSLVMQVMGKLGVPHMLMPVGGDPHDFQLRPSQAEALSKADVIFWDGPELMPDLATAIASLGAQAQSVPLLQDGGSEVLQFGDGEGVNPHAWLDPSIAQHWVGKIAAVLSAKDPDNAAIYAANAAKARADLQKLDSDLAAELAPAKGVPLVEFHDAFGYFAAHYGLNVVGTIELGDAATPSAARLQQIRTLLRDKKAVCVFPELGRDPRYIQTVTEGTSVRIGAGQDPAATSLGAVPGAELYNQLLRNLAKTVADCVRG
ncbi:zinc ABC transporter substrate-binding protein [Thioclava sp. BHET1]|nr:zinc ABC transporter substrate-binding protein [Thioclava sp. BHET1]